MFETTYLIDIILVAGFLLDLLFRDPRWLYHPVQAIGYSVIVLEKYTRLLFVSHLKIAGVVFLILQVVLWTGITVFILNIFYLHSQILLYIFTIYLVYSLLAVGSLTHEIYSVLKFIKSGNLSKAKIRAQGMVSRDLSKENKTGVIRAVIETATENISDGIVAPIFYYTLGGPVLMVFYKTVNTLDSMVGYRNLKYVDFGWASARMDDILNYVPARITGLILIFIGLILGDSVRGSVIAWYRDSQLGPSPNGGIPITTYAGARDIKLGGPCFTFEGSQIEIPFVGGNKINYNESELKATLKYVYLSALIAFVLAILFLAYLPTNISNYFIF